MHASALITAYNILITVTMYGFGRIVAKEYPSPLTTPVFLGTILVILSLLVSGYGDADYAQAREILTFFLGPATVALAVPLYRSRRILREHAPAALVGLAAGSAATMLAAVVAANLFHASYLIISFVFLKSAAAPVAVEVARILGGNPSVTAGVVIATGMLGAMLGPWLMDRLGVHHPLSRGLSLGTIAHAQGAAQAAAEGELQGAVAGIAMVMAAVLTAFLAPLFIEAMP